MVDSNIKRTITRESLRQFAKIANSCVHSVPKNRPTMTEVVASLQSLLELQETSNYSGESSDNMGTTWNMFKYFFPATKPDVVSVEQVTKALETEINRVECNLLFIYWKLEQLI